MAGQPDQLDPHILTLVSPGVGITAEDAYRIAQSLRELSGKIKSATPSLSKRDGYLRAALLIMHLMLHEANWPDLPEIEDADEKTLYSWVKGMEEITRLAARYAHKRRSGESPHTDN